MALLLKAFVQERTIQTFDRQCLGTFVDIFTLSPLSLVGSFRDMPKKNRERNTRVYMHLPIELDDQWSGDQRDFEF